MSTGTHILRKILKVSATIVVAVIACVVLLLAIATAILSPERLTSLANKYANEYLQNSTTTIGRMELNLWRSFPYATLQVDSLRISANTSGIDSAPLCADSLLFTKKFRVSLNMLKLLSGEIDVRDLMISGLQANVVQYTPETANYDIVPADTITESDTNTSLPRISLNSVEISNGAVIRYISIPDSIDALCTINAVQLSALHKSILQLVADASVSMNMAGTTLLRNLPIATNTYIAWNPRSDSLISIDNSSLEIGRIPIHYSLSLKPETPMEIRSFQASTEHFSLLDRIEYLAEEYTHMAAGFNTNLGASLSVELTKPYIPECDSLPSVAVTFDIPDAYVEGPRRRRIDRIALRGSVNVDGSCADSSTFTLSSMKLNGFAVELNAHGTITTPVSNPRLRCSIYGSASIGNLISMLGIPIDYRIGGDFKANTGIDARLSDVSSGRYNRIGLSGNMSLRNFHVQSPGDTISMYAHKASLKFNSRTNLKRENEKIDNLLGGRFTIDSLHVAYLDETMVLNNGSIGAVADINVTSLDGVHPFIPVGMQVEAEKVTYLMSDSSRVRFSSMAGKAAITAPKYKATLPRLFANITAKRAAYMTRDMRATATDAEIALELSPRTQKASRNNRAASSFASNTDNDLLDIELDSTARAMLRTWQLNGQIKSAKARLLTPYFPLRNSLSDLDMAFSLDSVMLNSARFRSGKSDMSLKGGVYNIRTTLLGRSNSRKPLTVKLDMDADTLDANQLIAATYAAANYAQSADSRTASLADSDDTELELAEAADTTITAFIIPTNLEADIDIHAKHGYYADMKFSNMSGCMVIHNGVLRLRDIMTHSDAGDIIFNAFYAARNKEDIKTAFDLRMNDIRIDRFIRLIPAVDSLMPLLKEMEGIVDANISASTRVDSALNVIFPSLTAAVRLHGDSLVLLDSETFASISKMLMFKNKKRNMIDNMDVELIVDNNSLELFPFTFQMDRYKVGVMGHNDLDMNLDYHISVLKSPIPFKFGLNIKGTPDKMKFRLGKAKYKDGAAAEVHEVVENAQINLRTEIENALRQGANAALKSRTQLDRTRIRNLRSNTELADTLNAADSTMMIQQGLIQAPPQPAEPVKKKKRK